MTAMYRFAIILTSAPDAPISGGEGNTGEGEHHDAQTR